MLNSAPINSHPLNSLHGSQQAQDDPVVIPAPQPPNPSLPPAPRPPEQGVYGGFPVPDAPLGHSFRWSAVVTLGGADVTALMTGSVRVDREEGGAGVAELQLFYPIGTPVITDIADRVVTVDFITDDGQDATQVRLFTGLVAEPSWDAPSRVMSITATDNLQQRVEALSIQAIDLLTGGVWSPDVFSPLDGRSRWDYAQERMSTRAASLDVSSDGGLRVSGWYAKPSADYIFGANTTIYNSITVDLAQLHNITNRIEIDISYRYPRLIEARATYSWQHSAGGFCSWLEQTTELPTKEMVLDATSSAGLVAVYASWSVLPPSMPRPCGKSAAWINHHDNLLLGVEWTGARRWSQIVTESYKFVLNTAAGAAEGRQVIARSGVNISVDSAAYAGWENSLMSIDARASQPSGAVAATAGDQHDEPRRLSAIGTALSVARTEIIASHRKTLVTWSVPTSMALGVDLSHTVEVNDQLTHTIGKCSRRVDELNFVDGSALTTLSISVMRGGGVSDPLVVPVRLGAGDSADVSGWGGINVLATQVSGVSGEVYDESLDGFSGNASAYNSESFPRRMAITAPPVSEEYTNEKLHSLDVVYVVGVPNDTLEL